MNPVRLTPIPAPSLSSPGGKNKTAVFAVLCDFADNFAPPSKLRVRLRDLCVSAVCPSNPPS
jgi:hypothetical protein